MSKDRYEDSIRIELKGRAIPRNGDGNPAFQTMAEVDIVFSEAERVALINRAIYKMQYQTEHHRKYSQRQREFERPFKAAAKRLFPHTSYINLTNDQMSRVVEAVKEEMPELFQD